MKTNVCTITFLSLASGKHTSVKGADASLLESVILLNHMNTDVCTITFLSLASGKHTSVKGVDASLLERVI